MASSRRRTLFSATAPTSMHSVLQLHYQIQRRTFVEMWVAVFSTFCLTLCFVTTLTVYNFIRHNHTHPTAMARRTRNVPQWRYVPDPKVTTVRQQFEQEQAVRIGDAYTNKLSSYEATMLDAVIASRKHRDPFSVNADSMPYNISNCPMDAPPLNYPLAWKLRSVLRHWHPDRTIVPDHIYQGLCTFDWRNVQHREAVAIYRTAEVPFVIQYHLEILPTAYRWQTPGYLQRLFGNLPPQRTEHSTCNRFMFWRRPPPSTYFWRTRTKTETTATKPFAPPTDNVLLTYAQWLQHARELEDLTRTTAATNNNNNSTATMPEEKQVSSEHWYFRLNAALPQTNTFLYDELPFFQPSYSTNEWPKKQSLFMVDSYEQRGINCRLGTRGATAAAHFDPTRNLIVMLGGTRRYILAHPNQRQFLELYPRSHPSGRHSSADWSKLATAANTNQSSHANANTHLSNDRPLWKAVANEVVLQAGDALYLPTSWFHFIVSLDTNYQCNARSGATWDHRNVLRECGFAGEDVARGRS